MNISSLTSQHSTKTFMIRNSVTQLCLHIEEQKDEYPEKNVIDSTWNVRGSECDPGADSQFWYWDRNNLIVHTRTGLCLSPTATKGIVLDKCDNKNIEMQFLCAGLFIELPHSEECITVNQEPSKNTVMESHNLRTAMGNTDEAGFKADLERELEHVLQQDEVSNTANVIVQYCDLNNSRQIWTMYNGEDNVSTTSIVVDGSISICSNSNKHKVEECYNETLVSGQGWLRCQTHGYFVAGLNYQEGSSTAVSSLLCCQSRYSFWGQSNKLVAGQPIFECSHEARWKSTTKSEFQCKESGYLNGVKLEEGKAETSSVYSLISYFECCRPEEEIKAYRHCYKISTHSAPLCERKAYVMTSLIETDSLDKTCIRETECCM